MRQRFWLWLYKLARSHLPPDYYDEMLGAYMLYRLGEMRELLGDSFACWFANNTGLPGLGPSRDTRDILRDMHYQR